MYITTLTSPFLLRKFIVEDADIQALCGDKVFPINAEEGTTGNFITLTATQYQTEDAKTALYNDSRVVEVECASQDYLDCIKMLDAIRKVVIRMTNAGHNVTIDDADEYKYAFVEGGQTWTVERVRVTLKNIGTEVELN